MEKDTFLSLDYEATQQEKRDRMNARLQIWQLFAALVSGFALVAVQSGSLSEVVGVYPLIATCIARYVGHSEMVLDQLKAYCLNREEKCGVCGYETWNNLHPFKSSGGHKKALLSALLITEGMATGAIVSRLFLDHAPLLASAVLIAELIAMVKTAWYLREVPRG